MEKIISWARALYHRGNFWGNIFCLGYEICVNTYVQGAVHIVASCILGAFAYKNQEINWDFLVLFGIIYLIILFVFSLCNLNRKNRTSLLERYEYSYSKITDAILSEYQKRLEIYNLDNDLSLDSLLKKYKETDFFTSTCFRMCDAINNILQNKTNNKFRTTTYLRTNNAKDEYHINAFSPLSDEPESYHSTFFLDDYKDKKKRDIPVHAWPFLNTRCEPLILIGEKNVKKAYKDFNYSNPTKLHIGIPISINGMITMVIQITSHDKYTDTDSTINDLIENVLNIFISYLKVVYVHQMMHEQLASAQINKED